MIFESRELVQWHSADLNDVMGLTRLIYNSCHLSGGRPVTLKFADVVGEVLISDPAISNAPLAFKHYISAAREDGCAVPEVFQDSHVWFFW